MFSQLTKMGFGHKRFPFPTTMIHNTWEGSWVFLSFLCSGMSIWKICESKIGRTAMLPIRNYKLLGFYWILGALKCCFDCLISLKYSSNKSALSSWSTVVGKPAPEARKEHVVVIFWPSQLSVVKGTLCSLPKTSAGAPNIVLRRRITYELASNQEHK